MRTCKEMKWNPQINSSTLIFYRVLREGTNSRSGRAIHMGRHQMTARKSGNTMVYWVAPSLLVLSKVACLRVSRGSSQVRPVCSLIGKGESPIHRAVAITTMEEYLLWVDEAFLYLPCMCFIPCTQGIFGFCGSFSFFFGGPISFRIWIEKSIKPVNLVSVVR